MDQRVEEVQAEPDGDDQSNDRFAHRLRLLKLMEGERVHAHQGQNRQTDRNERDIQHESLRAEPGLSSAALRKVSISNAAAGIRIS
jgi:hypothetical protein